MKTFMPFVLAATIMTAGVATYSPASADVQRGPADRAGTMTYLAKAGAADLYEIQSSQIAVRRARSPQVRQMARMLITDHTRTTRQLTAAARAAGLRPRPPVLEPGQRQMIRQLQGAPAGRFDQVYIGQQIPAHEQALDLHRRYARDGDVPGLRRAASGAVPVVEGHLAHARRLQR